jgi:cysteinyl-tRNA synthetase
MSMKYLGATLDIHGGGMDLMFPHHENELAQSESLTGQPFSRFWLHNGLTKIRTKTAGGQLESQDMHESSGNAVGAKDLILRHGPELFRYMLLTTHYRRPIDFSDEVLAAAARGQSTFSRLSERIQRLTGKPTDQAQPDMDAIAGHFLESEIAPFIREAMSAKIKFLEMMDDDFNTAGAIAVLHELAGLINAFLEHNKADLERPADVIEAASAAFQSLRALGRVIGLFRHADLSAPQNAAQKDLEKALALLVDLRNEARQSKNFALSDRIRDGLKEAGYVLEDRSGTTTWRKI